MASDIDNLSCPAEILEEDILEAMKMMEGYLEITPSDFKEFYTKAYNQARKRLLGSITAGMIMNCPVHTIGPEKNISEAAAAMANANISGLPVVDKNNEIVGIITEKDFLRELSKDKNPSFMSIIARCLSSKGCVALPVKKLMVRDIMISKVFAVDEETTLSGITSLLKEKEINRLPVKNKDNRLVGIITRSDIIKALFTTVCNY